jgi:galactokinase/mevalonate kinase-like predicted kinase
VRVIEMKMATIDSMPTTLVLTASDEGQADQFRSQLQLRERLGMLSGVDRWHVVPDPGGRRVGSGGSTVHVIRALAGGRPVEDALAGRRVLILHGGGKSRRMPAYAVCGKLFCPVPAPSESALPATLFDLQLDRYLQLPAAPGGHVVMCSGDVLLRFDPDEVDFSRPGLTGVGALEPADEACDHGVFAGLGEDGEVERFWQKPQPEELRSAGVLDSKDRAPIDLGIMGFDPDFARTLTDLADRLGGEDGHAVLDFYTEIACALGSCGDRERYLRTARRHGAGGYCPAELEVIWETLQGRSFHCSLVSRCEFLHFGTSEDYLRSAERLDYGHSHAATGRSGPIVMDSRPGELAIKGAPDAVVEGCTGIGEVRLSGENLLAGARIDSAFQLRPGVCLDVLPGRTAEDTGVFFYRIYGIRDSFKGAVEAGSCTFLNEPIDRWLRRHRVSPDAIWEEDASERSLWNARMFPAGQTRSELELVGWMQEDEPSEDRVRAWLDSPRWSMEQMSRLADGERFWKIRYAGRLEVIMQDLQHMVRQPDGLGAADLAWLMEQDGDELACRLLKIARGEVDPLQRARVLHSLGSALDAAECEPTVRAGSGEIVTAGELQDAAFDSLRDGMMATARREPGVPRCGVKADQIVWARSPVRLDVAGGWTDTPPYSLERGGTVVNAAVDLNGQPPVQVFARLSERPQIRLASIDLGINETIDDLSGLMQYESPAGEFSIAKAALALTGFSDRQSGWPEGTDLRQMLEQFGGGIELTTLCAVPKGSGLGTSSVLGATVIAAITRLEGRQLSRRELFHRVLLLEQMLTTGGGWQDQIGGAVGGVKLIRTEPGMVPDPEIRWLHPDAFCPTGNGGCTLLYYTGITRLAKDILHSVVSRYLDRDREALEVLRKLGESCGVVREALERREVGRLGSAVSAVWELNKRIDPGSTNERVEALFDRVEPYASGAKLLGAGGGGFMLIVCPDTRSAERCREDLEKDPPNELARFFDFRVSNEGLEVTVS